MWLNMIFSGAGTVISTAFRIKEANRPGVEYVNLIIGLTQMTIYIPAILTINKTEGCQSCKRARSSALTMIVLTFIWAQIHTICTFYLSIKTPPRPRIIPLREQHEIRRRLLEQQRQELMQAELEIANSNQVIDANEGN